MSIYGHPLCHAIYDRKTKQYGTYDDTYYNSNLLLHIPLTVEQIIIHIAESLDSFKVSNPKHNIKYATDGNQDSKTEPTPSDRLMRYYKK